MNFMKRWYLIKTKPRLEKIAIINLENQNYQVYCPFVLIRSKKQFLFPMRQKNILLLTLGLVVYSIYLYVPFYLNILSYYFKNQSLWIVQLSPALTAISTVFVVFYMDPKVAKFIDSSKGKKNSSVLFELIAIRMLGRFVILGSSAYLFFNLV